jgi:arsenate reductase-like glutaredoxin family protein
MNAEDLKQLVSELSAAEQSAVKEFITFLKERNGKSPETSFQAAIDEFIAAHPELLRRLAQ